MKQFLDFLPLVVFFAFISCTTFMLHHCADYRDRRCADLQLVRYRKVEKMALVTFVLVAVFGGLTLFFHNDEFIKWKVTVIICAVCAAHC
jgi:intracellular septation protein